jgi:hypothetical protein
MACKNAWNSGMALRNAVAARDSCVRLHVAELKFVRCSSFETHACKVCPYEIHTHEMHIREMYTREIYAHRSAAFLGRCRCGKGVPPNQTDLRCLRSPATTTSTRFIKQKPPGQPEPASRSDFEPLGQVSLAV